MRKRSACIALACASVVTVVRPAVAQLRIVTMNASNSGSTTTLDVGWSGPRNSTAANPTGNWMTTILTAIGANVSDDPNMAGNTGIIRPIDVLCLQEVNSAATTSLAYRNLLNTIYPGSNYQYSTINGSSTGSGTQGLIYNSKAVTLVATTVVGTSSTSGQPRKAMRYQLRLVGTGYTSASDFYIYNSHYKAGNTPADEARREPEATAIRTDANALGATLGTTPNIIYLGDYNIYGSAETFYQTLLASGSGTLGYGQAVDPINKPGSWTGSSSFSNIHTQSPFNSGTASLQHSEFSGTGGGMDDRFDQQLISTAMNDGHGVAYIPNSYQAFKNNGTHLFNNPINTGTNTGTVQDALASILDHLPVVADYKIPARLDVSAGAPSSTLMITGASSTINVAVSNTAPVQYAVGADTLDYSLTASGALSGSTSATGKAALAAASNHTVTLNTASAGAKTGNINVTSSSQQVASNTFNQAVNFTVLDHSNASFDSPGDTDARMIDFDYVPVGFVRSAGFSIYNLVGTPSFTAALNLDSIDVAGDSTKITTNVTTFTNLAAGSHNNYTASLDTSSPGNFTATHTFAVSDQDLPGAITDLSIVLTGTARVIPTGNFPVTGTLNLLPGEDWDCGPATLAPGITVTKSGPGTLHVSSAQSHGSGSMLAVTGGSLIMDTDSGGVGNFPLGINLTNSGTNATFNATQHLRDLTLSANTAAAMSADGNRLLHAQNLTIAANAKLDLNDNDLVVENSAFSDIQGLVLAGYSSTPDAGKTGIISTTGQNSSGKTVLALFDNALVGLTEWPAGGGNGIGPIAIVGKYTYYGDATLDGQVTADDYLVLDANRNTTPAAGVAWIKGDMTNDDSVTADDYLVLDANRGLGVGSPLGALGAAVPEPASAMMLVGAGILWLGKRRRNRSRRKS